MKLYTETTYPLPKVRDASQKPVTNQGLSLTKGYSVSIDDKLASSTSLSLQFKLSLSYKLEFKLNINLEYE
jgi:hypothetical protein